MLSAPAQFLCEFVVFANLRNVVFPILGCAQGERFDRDGERAFTIPCKERNPHPPKNTTFK